MLVSLGVKKQKWCRAKDVKSHCHHLASPPYRLAPGCLGCSWLPVAAATDRNLLVSVLSAHMLLLRQLPLLPRALLLSSST